MLDAYIPEPSPTPVGSPLPPMTLEESSKRAQTLYVKLKYLDPGGGGMGWALGCKGCASIVGKHATQLAHSEECRLRVIEKTKSNPVIAARIKATRLREDEWFSKTLEEERGERPNTGTEVGVGDESVPPVVGRTPAQEGGSSSSGGAAPSAPAEANRQSRASRVGPMPLDRESRKRSPEDRDESSKRKGGVVPAPKAAGQTKRRSEDQGVREKSRSSAETR